MFKYQANKHYEEFSRQLFQVLQTFTINSNMCDWIDF